MKNAYFIPNIQFRAPKKIDPLRVSQSISKNMMKEINKDEYGAGTKVPTDINLPTETKRSQSARPKKITQREIQERQTCKQSTRTRW